MRTPIVLPVITAILTLIAGLGAIAVGLLLAAIAMSGIGRLEVPGAGPVLGSVVVAAAIYGLVAIGAAAGILRDASWSLVAAGTIHGLGLLGALIAIATAGLSAPVLAGLGLTFAGFAGVILLAADHGRRPAARTA
jgi:hypothetical protein